MQFSFDKKITQNFYDATRYEWLETNGLGGWASSTIIGANTRRYHGLLVAAMQPPVGRVVLLSKLDETIVINNESYEFASNQYPGIIHPTGFKYQCSFEKDFFPVFEYCVNNGVEKVGIRKTTAALHGENTTLVLYKVVGAYAEFTLELKPFVAARDFHSLARRNDEIRRHAANLVISTC